MLTLKDYVLSALVAFVVLTGLAACAPQQQEGITPVEENPAATKADGSEDLSTPVTEAEGSYHDEGLPPTAMTDDFIVRPYLDVNQIFPGVLSVQFKGDGNAHITDVEVNRGNCAVSTERVLPRTVGFGNAFELYLRGCSWTEVLEVTIVTTEKTYYYNFQ